MPRLCVSVAAVLLLTSGCSLLHPPPEPRGEPSHSKAAVMAETDTASKADDRDPKKLSCAEAAFGVVFIPVYSTSCFVWWLMAGCPD